MLHIILVILKAFGILLAAVLLLILSIILLLLFVPVRYRISASFIDDKKGGQGQITWFLHLVSFRISYDFGEKPVFLLRILGIPVFPKPVKNKAEDIPASEPIKESGDEKSKETKPKEEFTPEVKKNEEVLVKPQIQAQLPEPESGSTPNRFLTRIREWIDKIKNIIRSVKEKIRTIFRKLSEFKILIQHYLEILKEDPTKALFKNVWGSVIYLLKHYGPHKIKGFIEYGLKDPALTGQLTGVLYVILPAALNEFDLRPEFNTETTLIRGEADMKGHIRICHILYVGLKLLFDKNLKHVLKRMKK